MNNQLIHIIKFTHLSLITFIITIPIVHIFFKKKETLYSLDIVIVLLLYFIYKWTSKNDKCGLTILEYYATNKPYKSGFIYRLLDGIVFEQNKMSEDQFNEKLMLTTIIWLIICILIRCKF